MRTSPTTKSPQTAALRPHPLQGRATKRYRTDPVFAEKLRTRSRQALAQIREMEGRKPG